MGGFTSRCQQNELLQPIKLKSERSPKPYGTVECKNPSASA